MLALLEVRVGLTDQGGTAQRLGIVVGRACATAEEEAHADEGCASTRDADPDEFLRSPGCGPIVNIRVAPPDLLPKRVDDAFLRFLPRGFRGRLLRLDDRYRRRELVDHHGFG